VLKENFSHTGASRFWGHRKKISGCYSAWNIVGGIAGEKTDGKIPMSTIWWERDKIDEWKGEVHPSPF